MVMLLETMSSKNRISREKARHSRELTITIRYLENSGGEELDSLCMARHITKS